MDGFIDRIGLSVSTWLWFARSTRLGSDEMVDDLIGDMALPIPRRDGEAARTTEAR
jgi:hypothetical protein